jgi:hypothetical protein
LVRLLSELSLKQPQARRDQKHHRGREGQKLSHSEAPRTLRVVKLIVVIIGFGGWDGG